MLLIVFAFLYIAGEAKATEPDSVYLFSYSTPKNNNKNGLHFAWSHNGETWHEIGNEFGFLKSDYGRWGTEKRMIDPYLIEGGDGLWHCVWSVNEHDNIFAHASSADLVNWKRQSYNYSLAGESCHRPVIDYYNGNYAIVYAISTNRYFNVSTHDFKSYTPSTQIASYGYVNSSIVIKLPGGVTKGQLHRVAWSVVDKMIKTVELKKYRNNLYSETTSQDAQRFAGLKPLNATVELLPEKTRPISDLLLGVFFEDINYAADGGLYAELIQNRDFEYALSDKEGRDKNWNAFHSWELRGENALFTIDSVSPLHVNNEHYAVLNIKKPAAFLVNSGFDGIAVKKGEKYNFSAYIRRPDGKAAKLRVRLVDRNSKVLATAELNTSSKNWKNIQTVLTSSNDDDSAHLELEPDSEGRLLLDMISLFPQKTFKDRKNGLRADLAQTIADMHPRFVRFPGGCVAHGDGLANMYRWKNTIGPLHERKPQRNLWNYHQTAGLGYFEYFQFCEDIGAVPLPVVAAGVPCQNSAIGGGGQQGGIPMWEMEEYVQEILDLIEYANGDINTVWGKKRAEAGHPKPFNLKYIGIGNEDLITDVFEERFTMIFDTLKKKHPEITVIGTAGPFYEGTDYEEGWAIANKLKVPMVDEHYYLPPAWFIHNQDFYDSYDRTGPKVYLGEYAAHLPGRPNNLETALAEALYLTSLERNGDIVHMSSYAPLLAKEKHTQWNPDLVYFNNTEVKPTVGYQVQKLFGQHAGDKYVPAVVTVSDTRDEVRKRFAFSVVRDSKSGDLIIKMVNMLPVAVNASLNLKGIIPADTKAMRIVLQGKPDDKGAMPVESACEVKDQFNVEMAGYSFSVIRIKAK